MAEDAPDATPSATAGALDPSEIRQLLDLPSDLLQRVLTQLVHDELSLLRVGATCKTLSELASAADLWRPGLTRFFDGEVPPALATCANPQRELREQVLCAQRLAAKERKARSFQVVDVDFQNIREWRQALDDRVAEAQMKLGGARSAMARPGRPYYGCSGSAYVFTTLAYGKYVKNVVCNDAASHYEGISADEARLTVWVLAHADERPETDKGKGKGAKPKVTASDKAKTGTADVRGRPKTDKGKGKGTKPKVTASDKAKAGTADMRGPHKSAAVVRTAMSECDYGPMAEWKDRKLAELAEQAGHKQLAARYEKERLEAVRAGELYRSSRDKDVNIGKEQRTPGPDALGRPKLLAGLYGGLFGLEETASGFAGMLYSLECPADGSNITDYSKM